MYRILVCIFNMVEKIYCIIHLKRVTDKVPVFVILGGNFTLPTF